MSDIDPNEPMSLNDIRKVLAFLMSKLSSADLEELDGQMLGEAQAMAGDSRFGADNNRALLLRLGPKARRAVRQAHDQGLRQQQAQDALNQRDFHERFPNAKRFGV